jgi:hypothetical protein
MPAASRGLATGRIELFIADPVSVHKRAVATGAIGRNPIVRTWDQTIGPPAIKRMLQDAVADPFGHLWVIGKFPRLTTVRESHLRTFFKSVLQHVSRFSRTTLSFNPQISGPAGSASRTRGVLNHLKCMLRGSQRLASCPERASLRCPYFSSELLKPVSSS